MYTTEKSLSEVGLGNLVISEIRGPTFNIEGPLQGTRCTLVRLFGCNLHCKWCDVEYSWRGRAFSKLTTDEVYTCIDSTRTKHIVITGGEPLLQTETLISLTSRLHSTKHTIEIETNGTIRPHPHLYTDRWSVSPKLGNSGMANVYYEVLEQFIETGKAIFKFPCWSKKDVYEVQDHNLPADLVYILPIGNAIDGLDQSLYDIASVTLQAGFNLTDRLGVRVKNYLR